MLLQRTLATAFMISVGLLSTGCSSQSGVGRLLSPLGLSSNRPSATKPYGDAKYEELAQQMRPGEPADQGQGALATAKSAQDSIGGAFKNATASVSEALTIKPKVTPADDPTSLLSDPGKLDANVYYQAGRLAEHNGNLPTAIKQYKRALEQDPKDVRVLISMARLFDRQEQFSQAVGLYQRATEVAPKNAMVHNDLGLCYARQDQHQAAVRNLQQAVNLEPKRKLYRNNLATVLVEMGQIDQAWKHLSHVHSSAVANYNLGYLLNRNGQKQAAQQRFALACQADPSMKMAKKMLDQLDGELGSQVIAEGSSASQADAVAQNGPSARRARSSARVPVMPVSSPVELRRTPPPSDSQHPASSPAAQPEPQRKRSVPVSLHQPAEPVVKPATEPLPQPKSLKFPVRTVAAYVTSPDHATCDMELPTPDMLDVSASILPE